MELNPIIIRHFTTKKWRRHESRSFPIFQSFLPTRESSLNQNHSGLFSVPCFISNFVIDQIKGNNNLYSVLSVVKIDTAFPFWYLVDVTIFHAREVRSFMGFWKCLFRQSKQTKRRVYLTLWEPNVWISSPRENIFNVWIGFSKRYTRRHRWSISEMFK
jgi:hypothetical protein